MSQLFKITFKISGLLPSLKIEKIKQKWNTSWFENLASLINIQINKLNKKKTIILHYKKI